MERCALDVLNNAGYTKSREALPHRLNQLRPLGYEVLVALDVALTRRGCMYCIKARQVKGKCVCLMELKGIV
jgi:hypothetical protein